MTQEALAGTTAAIPVGNRGVVNDLSGDKQAFHVPWGKAMMWIFLLSDTFIFSCFLITWTFPEGSIITTFGRRVMNCIHWVML